MLQQCGPEVLKYLALFYRENYYPLLITRTRASHKCQCARLAAWARSPFEVLLNEIQPTAIISQDKWHTESCHEYCYAHNLEFVPNARLVPLMVLWITVRSGHVSLSPKPHSNCVTNARHIRNDHSSAITRCSINKVHDCVNACNTIYL